jgi:agmatinase
MLSPGQIAATRRALYPGLPAGDADRLPVSALSMAERALERMLALGPRAVPVILGGDHSVAWPAVKALAAARPGMALLHLDAHTDLLEERLGVRYCFGTWAFHASRLLGPGRTVQVGIRASRHDRGHWEGSLGVRQIWADEVRADPTRALEAALEALRRSGASWLYLSNDIDGTDSSFAEATGTPEPGGLSPAFVAELIGRAGGLLPLAGADLVEVAPAIARSPEGAERTLATAAGYLRQTLAAALGGPV